MAVTGLDHVIFGTPDLEATLADIERRTGVQPVHGGSHTGRGTRNALFATGDGTYVELLAPDPAQPPEALARIGPRVPDAPRITTWAAKCDDLEGAAARARAAGLDLGDVEAMSRARPDGHELHWRLTRTRMVAGGLVPFLIDWGDTEHPGRSAPAGCTIVSFRAEHPDPDLVRRYLAALDLDDVLPVDRGDVPRLALTLATPRGEVTLS